MKGDKKTKHTSYHLYYESHKFDWENYISLSEKLVDSVDGDESYWRCAISRAYYGVYWIARNMAGLKYLNAPQPHLYVVEHYQGSLFEDKVNIGNLLDELRKCRGKSDYEEHSKITEEIARDKVQKARICSDNIFQCYPHKNY